MTKVITLSENLGQMTNEEGLAFIERMRRQLDRFALLPGTQGQKMNPECEAGIRQICDKVEREIHQSLCES